MELGAERVTCERGGSPEAAWRGARGWAAPPPAADGSAPRSFSEKKLPQALEVLASGSISFEVRSATKSPEGHKYPGWPLPMSPEKLGPPESVFGNVGVRRGGRGGAHGRCPSELWVASCSACQAPGREVRGEKQPWVLPQRWGWGWEQAAWAGAPREQGRGCWEVGET